MRIYYFFFSKIFDFYFNFQYCNNKQKSTKSLLRLLPVARRFEYFSRVVPPDNFQVPRKKEELEQDTDEGEDEHESHDCPQGTKNSSLFCFIVRLLEVLEINMQYEYLNNFNCWCFSLDMYLKKKYNLHFLLCDAVCGQAYTVIGTGYIGHNCVYQNSRISLKFFFLLYTGLFLR